MKIEPYYQVIHDEFYLKQRKSDFREQFLFNFSYIAGTNATCLILLYKPEIGAICQIFWECYLCFYHYDTRLDATYIYSLEVTNTLLYKPKRIQHVRYFVIDFSMLQL